MTDIERIPQHRHCAVCGKAYVGDDKRYCSANCKENKRQELTKTKRKLYLIWLAGAGLMVVAIAILLLVK